MICAVDKTPHETLEDLHRHIRFKLKLTQEEYYMTHAPRRDLWTGEVIPFKRPVERYLQIEFAHKNNLKKFCREHPDGRKWAIDWLAKRRVEKGLTHPPTQVELRSLMCPSIPHYETIGGYNAICRDLGYTIRFDGDLAAAAELSPDATVIIDTREQAPLSLSCLHVKSKVHCGDYGLAEPHDQGVYIERKSLGDFIGTLSDRVIERRGGKDSNLERFARELERAAEMDAYIVLLCEADINQALGFNFLPQYKHSKITADHLFKNLRDLLVRFPNFQALFVAGRGEAATAVPRLLAMGRSVERIDLEYQYEIGDLRFEP